jgi:pimeloyl-ACP methyl ester carboxylesterase
METFTRGRISIAYHDVGDGPAVIFIHNGGTSSTIWRHQVEDLKADHRAIALDLPGFGASPLPRPPAELHELVDTVIDLIRAEDLAPALLVGNCMGSNIAVSVADREPELVRGILTVNPLTEVSFSGGKIGFLHKLASSRTLGKPTRGVLRISRHIRVPRFIGALTLRFQLGRSGIRQGLHHDPELLATQTRGDQLPALIDVLEDMSAYGGVDTLAEAPAVPTWIVWGDQNHVLSRKKAAGLTDRLGAEQVEVVDNCGHLAMLEKPEQITELIRRLDAHVAGGADRKVTA